MTQFKHTPAQARAAWIAALRSGEYRQGAMMLRQQKQCGLKFCCLGVACDLFIRLEGQGDWNMADEFIDGFGIRSGSYLTRQMQRWLGFHDQDTAKPRTKRLTHLNDYKRWSFRRIAAYVERLKFKDTET